MITDREDGFTLIEVLVALAILSVSLAVILSVISSTMDRVRKERNETTAVLLVQSLLARVGNDIPLAIGERDGIYSNGYRWHIDIESYGTSDDRKSWPVSAYRIEASVKWNDGAPHSASLTTLRTAVP